MSSTDEDPLPPNNARAFSSSDEDSINDGDDNVSQQQQQSNIFHNQSFQSSHYSHNMDEDGDSEDDNEEDRNNTSLYSSTSTWMTQSRVSGLETSAMQDDSMMDGSDVDDDKDDADEDNYNDNDDTKVASVSVAARGKVLIRPTHKSDDDESNNNNHDDNDEDKNEIQENDNEKKTIVNHSSLGGKPLSVLSGAAGIAKNDDDVSSSDDELLVTHKTKSTPAKSAKAKKPVPPKKIRKKPGPKPKKKPHDEKKSSRKKRSVDDDVAIEAVAVLNDAGQNDSDSDAVEAVIEAVVIPQAPPKKKRKKPGPKPKKKPHDEKKDSSKSKRSRGDKSSTNDKKRRLSVDNGSDSDEPCYEASVIPHERLRAAEHARGMLVNSVQRLPFVVSDTHSIRNFGRIKIEKGINALDTLYSNATALHPVGYSCDRYEFSPVHGRILKLRCDIVEGKCEEKSNDKKLLAEQVENGDKGCQDKSLQKQGPIFRIMWGSGIDELDEGQSFPFDLYSAGAPLGNEVDAVAIPVGKDTVKVKPEQGMRVKVNFNKDNNTWYLGTILQVSEKKEQDGSKKKAATRGAVAKNERKQKFKVQILYDDGVKEEVTYPDPDVILVPPGKINCLVQCRCYI